MAEPTPPPSLTPPTQHAHECLQRALLASGGRYALPNPYPDGWRVGPLGIEIQEGEPPEPHLWLVVPWELTLEQGPPQDLPQQLQLFAQIVGTLTPAQRTQTTLALTTGELPPPPLLDALERSLDVAVVACTARESAPGPRAQSEGSGPRAEALLRVENHALTAVDPAAAWKKSMQSAVQAVENRDFFERLRQITPQAHVTPTVVAICVAVWLIQVLSGVSPGNPGAVELQEWGANAAMVTLEGQPWRLITAGFLHGGIIHLGINMWVLRDVGPVCERLFGSLPYLAVYLIAVVGGGLASLAWHPEIVASVGASGGIFGLGGAILGFITARRHTVPASVFLRFRRSLGAFVVYNLIFGFAINAAPVGINVDNAGHVGGLVAGFIAGFLLSRPLPPGPTTWKRLLWIPLLLAGLGGSFAAIQNSPEIRAAASETREQIAALPALRALDTWIERLDQDWAEFHASPVAADQRAEAEARFQLQTAEIQAGIEALELPQKFDRVRTALLNLASARADMAEALADPDLPLEPRVAAEAAAMDELERAFEGL